MAEREQMQAHSRKVLGCGCFVWLLVGLTVALVFVAVIWPIWERLTRHPPSPAAACMVNLKQIAVGAQMYAQDYDGHLPPLSGWAVRISPNVGDTQVFNCPADRGDSDLSYGMNPELSALQIADFAEDVQVKTVLFYDGIGQVLIERHHEGANYAFLDGHVKWLADPPAGFETMQVIDGH